MTIKFHLAKKTLVITNESGITAWISRKFIPEEFYQLLESEDAQDKIRVLWALYRIVSSRNIHFSRYCKLNLLISKYTTENLGSIL